MSENTDLLGIMSHQPEGVCVCVCVCVSVCNTPDTGPHQLTERVANPGFRRGRRAL